MQIFPKTKTNHTFFRIYRKRLWNPPMLNWLWLWNPANSAWVTNKPWRPCVKAKLNWYWLPAILQLWGEHHTIVCNHGKKVEKKKYGFMCFTYNLLYHTTGNHMESCQRLRSMFPKTSLVYYHNIMPENNVCYQQKVVS